MLIKITNEIITHPITFFCITSKTIDNPKQVFSIINTRTINRIIGTDNSDFPLTVKILMRIGRAKFQ